MDAKSCLEKPKVTVTDSPEATLDLRLDFLLSPDCIQPLWGGDRGKKQGPHSVTQGQDSQNREGYIRKEKKLLLF